jgi:hypothetical protein
MYLEIEDWQDSSNICHFVGEFQITKSVLTLD